MTRHMSKKVKCNRLIINTKQNYLFYAYALFETIISKNFVIINLSVLEISQIRFDKSNLYTFTKYFLNYFKNQRFYNQRILKKYCNEFIY